MKTIQIAPNKNEYKLENDYCIVAEWDEFKTIITLPRSYKYPVDQLEIIYTNISQAIAICSKTSQIEELLTKLWEIKKGKVTVENYKIK